jgi:hypothetical protein
MPSYISSNANRFYTALETVYGTVGSIAAVNRIPAVKLVIKQQTQAGTRKDKTGSRTFAGTPAGVRRRTDFNLQTYLTSWDKTATGPAYGPLFEAALGASPWHFAGGTVASITTAGRLGFGASHGLIAGQAISCAGEVRFAAAIVDGQTVQLNAPFSNTPGIGAALTAAVTYSPATNLPSVSIFDYWTPATAVQRLLTGAGVDQLDILVNGDYHEFHFSGLANDVIDSSSFESGAAELLSFPAEPTVGAFDYSIVPGHMGEAWLGTSPTQFSTITSATLTVKNSLDVRNKEFGSVNAFAISPGMRTVTASFDLYSMDDVATAELYQAARQRSPISIMFQLGESDGQVMAVYLKSVVPEVPEFDDTENRLRWNFRASRAQGTIDDEVYVAFG